MQQIFSKECLLIMKKFVSKSILGSMSAASLLMVASPAIDAAEQSAEKPTAESLQNNDQENIKEVTTYEDFKNAEGPVSINPANLSDKQLEELGQNPQQVKEEFGISKDGIQREATKQWSQKISKNQLAGGAATIGGVITIVSGLLSGGTVATVSGGAFSVISGVITSSKHNGVTVGGTATKRLVRENPYQKPVKKWVYKITWAKPY